MVIIIFLILLLSDGWWARYAPYLYFIVIISITILGYNRTKKCRLLFILYALLIFINSVINLAVLSKNELSVSGMSKMKLEELEGTTIELCLENNNFSGIIYNLNDYNIEYEISEKNDCELKLYGNYANYSER